jgi:GDP-4-dehydro-6-deoxy-D-mannose reductase
MTPANEPDEQSAIPGTLRVPQSAIPKRAFITGAAGFVGKHLLGYLSEHTDWELFGNSGIEPEVPRLPYVNWLTTDLTDRKQTDAAIERVRPDIVFHLAAQSNVQRAFEDPQSTLMNNIVSELNVLETLRKVAPEARIMITCSSEQYGLVRPEDIPIDEDTPFRPNNPYAVSKVAQDTLALQYFLSYGQKTIRVRPFNHIGPGQTEHFVTAAFARQVALIEAGKQEPVIYVGNLEAERDFTDVRDMVRAYYLAITMGEPGEVYNIGYGKGLSIQWVLDTLVSMSNVKVEVRREPARMRPADIPSLVCNPARFHARTGWKPQIPIEHTLRDILDYWREKVSKT